MFSRLVRSFSHGPIAAREGLQSFGGTGIMDLKKTERHSNKGIHDE
jgi:hypothetical protein